MGIPMPPPGMGDFPDFDFGDVYKCEEQTKRKCPPCESAPPPVYHINPSPTRKHGCPGRGDHMHYFAYHQGPLPDCICRLKKYTRCL